MQNNIKRIDTKSAFSAEEEDEFEIVETKQNQPQTLLAKIIFFKKRYLGNLFAVKSSLKLTQTKRLTKPFRQRLN